jgi:hypothetical protein
MESMCNYYVGETVLSLQKATLIPGGSESLVYTTLSGGVGMLVPFTSREVSKECVLVLFTTTLYRLGTSTWLCFSLSYVFFIIFHPSNACFTGLLCGLGVLRAQRHAIVKVLQRSSLHSICLDADGG